MRAYLQQRSQIQDLKDQIATTSASIDAMENEKRRWNDDAYLEQQAREHVGFVFPGETPYQVIDLNGQPMDGNETLHDPSTIVKTTPPAWWDVAWESVELAGNPPAPQPPPATSITVPRDTESGQ
jgi:hypothetical protein